MTQIDANPAICGPDVLVAADGALCCRLMHITVILDANVPNQVSVPTRQVKPMEVGIARLPGPPV